jgi:hypothetical protein
VPGPITVASDSWDYAEEAKKPSSRKYGMHLARSG